MMHALSPTTSHTWLAQYRPKDGAYGEPDRSPVENDPAIGAAIDALWERLDGARRTDPFALSRALAADPMRADVRQLLAQLGPMRIVALLGTVLDPPLPDADAIMGALMERDATRAGLFLKGMLAASERLTLLERIYSADRVRALSAVCGGLTADKETA